MANHDRYENDILKQLTRIANALERIETKFPNQKIMTPNEMGEFLDLPKVKAVLLKKYNDEKIDSLEDLIGGKE